MYALMWFVTYTGAIQPAAAQQAAELPMQVSSDASLVWQDENVSMVCFLCVVSSCGVLQSVASLHSMGPHSQALRQADLS